LEVHLDGTHLSLDGHHIVGGSAARRLWIITAANELTAIEAVDYLTFRRAAGTFWPVQHPENAADSLA
jgi:hypothetical protein